MDPGLAEAHASLALGKMFYDRDFQGAENSFRRAIETNPEYVGTRMYYSLLLAALKRFDEAIAEAERCFHLDPLDLTVGSLYGGVFLWARRYEQSIDVLRKLLALEPRFYPAYFFLGQIYSTLGRNDEALTTIKTAASHVKGTFMTSTLGYVYGRIGDKNAALACLEELAMLSKQMYVDPAAAGAIYLGLGDIPNLQRTLEASVEDRNGSCILFGVNPIFDSVRSEPFFQELCRRIGLP